PDVGEVIPHERAGCEVNRLTTAQDAVGDLWCQESKRKDTADISNMDAGFICHVSDGAAQAIGQHAEHDMRLCYYINESLVSRPARHIAFKNEFGLSAPAPER